jgi:hypothetical protein
MEVVREVDWELRPEEVSQADREALARPNGRGEARTVLVVAPTHEETRRLTDAIREDRQRRGELGAGEMVKRYVPLNGRKTQKQETRQYRPGMVLVFHKATKEVGRMKQSKWWAWKG